MALTLTTLADKAGAAPSAPVFLDRLQFNGDNSYPSNGWPFKALFQAKVKGTREPLCIVAGDCGR